MKGALILAFVAACVPSAAQIRGQDSASRVTFLTPAVSGGYDHRGCTPDPIALLVRHVSETRPEAYVRYDLRKLEQAGVPPYYIFSRRYCTPIGRVLGANLFVMTRLVLVGVGPSGECVDDLFDVEMKAFSSVTRRERSLFHASRVSASNLALLFRGREQELVAKILQVGEKE